MIRKCGDELIGFYCICLQFLRAFSHFGSSTSISLILCNYKCIEDLDLSGICKNLEVLDLNTAY